MGIFDGRDTRNSRIFTSYAGSTLTSTQLTESCILGNFLAGAGQTHPSLIASRSCVECLKGMIRMDQEDRRDLMIEGASTHLDTLVASLSDIEKAKGLLGEKALEQIQANVKALEHAVAAARGRDPKFSEYVDELIYNLNHTVQAYFEHVDSKRAAEKKAA